MLERSACRNALLRKLSPEDFDVLAVGAERVEVKQLDRLVTAGKASAWVYFPDSGAASETFGSDPPKLEIGVVGREGVVGALAVLGEAENPFGTFVQMPGTFIRVPATGFRHAVQSSPPMLEIVTRFLHAYSTQLGSTAFAGASLQIEQRLARWLLMAHDRSDGDSLSITHDTVARLLDVRRPGVTVALHILEGEHAIKATRGRIRVLDRDKLKSFAGPSYGIAEAQYERSMRSLPLVDPLQDPLRSNSFEDGLKDAVTNR
jgi:CRP-like cAMP-binding protein